MVWCGFPMDPTCVPIFKEIWEGEKFFVDLVCNDPMVPNHQELADYATGCSTLYALKLHVSWTKIIHLGTNISPPPNHTMIRNMAFPVTGIINRFLPTTSHGWLPKCFWNAAWFMHNDCRKWYSKFSSFLHQEIQGKFISVLEKEILPSYKVHLPCCCYFSNLYYYWKCKYFPGVCSLILLSSGCFCSCCARDPVQYHRLSSSIGQL